MAYKWDPQDYNQNSGSQKAFADELIAKLDLTGSERVIDIGCGDGKISAEIARLVPTGSVVGIDSSPSMIEYARETFPQNLHPNLDFVLADATRMSYANEFDVAFSTAALHWIIDHGPVLAGLFNCLKPGGRFLLQMGGKGNAAGVIKSADSVIKKPEWREYFTVFPFPYGFYGSEEYKQWAEQAGFIVDRAELVPKDVLHSDRAALEGWFRTTWLPYLNRLPAGKQTEFIGTVISEYLKDNPANKDGSIRVKMIRLEIAGRKP